MSASGYGIKMMDLDNGHIKKKINVQLECRLSCNKNREASFYSGLDLAWFGCKGSKTSAT